MRLLQVLFSLGAITSLIMGFNKMYVYENPEGYFGGIKNAYVGADSYNYVINGTYSIAFFVLFGSLLVSILLIEVIIRTTPKAEVEEVTLNEE